MPQEAYIDFLIIVQQLLLVVYLVYLVWYEYLGLLRIGGKHLILVYENIIVIIFMCKMTFVCLKVKNMMIDKENLVPLKDIDNFNN